MKRVVLVTAAFVAAVAVWAVSRPPRRVALDSSWADGSIPGSLHVHSRASDGRGTWDDIAAAAARAGLKFVVVTDHGDGTRPPEPPSYRSGVLCIDAVEISTRGGHYLALGLPQTPYPLGGDSASVVEDVHRFGGFGVAAHPDSPKADLRWSDWTLPIDGVELINPDSNWREHAVADGARGEFDLLRALLAYPARQPEAIASLLTDVSPVRRQWLKLAASRPVVALAGVDAHAQIALGESGRFAIPIPSYEASFQSLSVHPRTAEPLSGDASRDAALILSALEAGRAYVAIDGWATPPAFEFTATAGSRVVGQGEALSAGEPVTLHVRSNAPDGFAARVWRNDAVIDERADRAFDLPVGAAPALYSIEVRRLGGEGPAWITSNAIVIGDRPAPQVAGPAPDPGRMRTLFDGRSAADWSYESGVGGLAVVEPVHLISGDRMQLRFALPGGASLGQYAAAAVGTPAGVAGAEAVSFGIRAEKPMRIAVQVRAEVAGSLPERWERSTFVSTQEEVRTVRFDDMRPVGQTHTSMPPLDGVRTIMFVVDTTNSKPGASGRLWLGSVELRGGRGPSY